MATGWTSLSFPFVYGGLGLALPLLLGWPVPWLVAANIVGVIIAMSLAAAS